MTGLFSQMVAEFNALTAKINELETELSIFRKYNPYQYGKIYKITNTKDDMIYVGCTSLPLDERYAIHRKKSGTGKMRIHQHMRHVGRDHFSIHLIKDFPTYSRWHLENEEFRVQSEIPLNVRLFSHRPRIPFGLTFLQKNRTYSRAKYYRDKEKRIQLRLASLVQASEGEMDSDTNSE